MGTHGGTSGFDDAPVIAEDPYVNPFLLNSLFMCYSFVVSHDEGEPVYVHCMNTSTLLETTEPIVNKR